MAKPVLLPFRRRLTLLSLLLVVMAGTGPRCAAQARARSGTVAPVLAPDLVGKAIDTYAPVLMMHKVERCLPTSPNGLFRSAHGEGTWTDLTKVPADYKGNPRVKACASRNGHALFIQPGRDSYATVKAGPVAFRLLNDTQKVGIPLDPRDLHHRGGVIRDSPCRP